MQGGLKFSAFSAEVYCTFLFLWPFMFFPLLPPWTSNALCNFFHAPSQLNHSDFYFYFSFLHDRAHLFLTRCLSICICHMQAAGFHSPTFWMDVMFAFCWKSPVILCSKNSVLNLFRLSTLILLQFTNSFLPLCCCIQNTLYENRKLYLSNRTCCWDSPD